MNIELASGISLTTERAESSQGVPVLVIDGTAYGRGEGFGAPLQAALERGSAPFAALIQMAGPETHLTSLCTQHSGYGGEAMEALRLFHAL